MQNFAALYLYLCYWFLESLGAQNWSLLDAWTALHEYAGPGSAVVGLKLRPDVKAALNAMHTDAIYCAILHGSVLKQPVALCGQVMERTSAIDVVNSKSRLPTAIHAAANNYRPSYSDIRPSGEMYVLMQEFWGEFGE
ncbi:hypothetical protein WJX73_010062 [Symbiochloris irregularis]|uniref:Uncharacterized protein n=1 Tax=Symbiochloris irregularis TaxID=706552 RepID=A0AAW1PPW5_9CHLO